MGGSWGGSFLDFIGWRNAGFVYLRSWEILIECQMGGRRRLRYLRYWGLKFRVRVEIGIGLCRYLGRATWVISRCYYFVRLDMQAPIVSRSVYASGLVRLGLLGSFASCGTGVVSPQTASTQQHLQPLSLTLLSNTSFFFPRNRPAKPATASNP